MFTFTLNFQLKRNRYDKSLPIQWNDEKIPERTVKKTSISSNIIDKK